MEDRATDLRIRPAVEVPQGSDPLQHWTRIEAVLKADGRGLRIDPAAIGFTPAAGGMLATTPDGARYAVHDLAIPGGHPAAIALGRQVRSR